jgi:mycofactocin precursor peptide peptidase
VSRLWRLDRLTWPEIRSVAAGSLLVVPVGSTEQHGPHLPLTVDTDIAAALAAALAQARADVLVAPAVSYGSSGEHAGFPGTLSVGQQAVEAVLLELVRSADAFAGVVLISGHGGNAAPLARAVARLRREGRRVLPWAPEGPADDSHAGHTETSVMLALCGPDRVRMDAAAAGDVRPLPEILPVLRESGVRAVSGNGVLGDPRTATAAEGHRILAAWTASLLTAVERWSGR